MSNEQNEFASRSEEQETNEAQTSRKELIDVHDEEERDQQHRIAEQFVEEEEEDFYEEANESEEEDFLECENEFDLPENVVTQANDLNQATNIINGFERLILRRRQELAAELRGLQFYFRPVAQVTNQLRTQLEQAQSGNQASPRSDQAAQLRSEQLESEMNALRSSERVRAFLNSNVRRDLENMLSSPRTAAQPQHFPNQAQVSQPQVNPTINPPVPEQTRNVNAWLAPNQTLLHELTREQILTELNGLMYTQPVGNLLNSQFRESLEHHLENALRRTGSNGQQTRRVIQQLASNLRSRQVQQLNNEADNNSDSGLETRARHTTLHNSREIRELKNEMKELKSMLKLTFELQLDMQRSLKQEISALISNTFQSAHSSSLLINSTRPSAEGTCIICSESQVDTVLYQCGHMCTCYACSMSLKEKALNCPVCRAVIKDIVRAYRSAL